MLNTDVPAGPWPPAAALGWFALILVAVALIAAAWADRWKYRTVGDVEVRTNRWTDKTEVRNPRDTAWRP
jgi:hypothetical protein